MLGVLIAIISLGKIFDYLFTNYPVNIWAYFFGLVLASVFFVGKTVGKWTFSVIISFIVGTSIAVLVSILNPATENQNFFYLIICGVVAICSMILPGLSGSFILILMGNYQLVAIEAINDRNVEILLPVAIGAAGGLLLFSHILSWVFKNYRNQTISLLTGFILGSVSILWPWQKPVYLLDKFSTKIINDGGPIITGYKRILPETINTEFWLAIIFIVIGIISIWAIEKVAENEKIKS